MYGSFMRLKVKPGQEQAVADVLKEWETDLKPNIKGAIGGLLLKPDSGSGELLGAAVFEDKASYMANADNPAQHQCTRRCEACWKPTPSGRTASTCRSTSGRPATLIHPS